MGKVSIIIPVYGVQDYLEECMESVISQTYQNLEILLIDDESPDRCPEICDAYEKKDQRIKVVHQKNGGAANARNTGLSMASGDEICFIDSDDKIECHYIERLRNELKQKKADIAVCSFQRWYPDKMEPWEKPENQEYTGKEYLRKFLSDWTCGLLWNKMFRAEVLQGVKFEEGHKIDDEFFTYKAVLNAKKIITMKDELCFYRMRASGVMLSYEKHQKQMLIDQLEYMQERYELVVRKYPDLKAEYLYHLTDNLIRLKRESEPYEEIKIVVKQARKKYFKTILFGKISWKMKYSFLRSCFEKRAIIQKTDIRKADNFFR